MISGGSSMEYRLNKIDINLRQRINDSTKEGKVHNSQNVLINKDKKEEKKEKKDYKLDRYSKNKKLIVDAIKTENIEIEAYKENSEAQELNKGSILDVKK
jgi:hypothetical protein